MYLKNNFRYVILNVQKYLNKEENSTNYAYKEVGSWDNIFKLNLRLDDMKFPEENQNFPSVCSETCGFGHVKVDNYYNERSHLKNIK